MSAFGHTSIKLSPGAIGLARAYWLWFVFGGFLWATIFRIASVAAAEPIPTLIGVGGAVYGLVTAIVVWLAATRYEGAQILAVIAKLTICVAVIVNVLVLASLIRFSSYEIDAPGPNQENNAERVVSTAPAVAIGQAAYMAVFQQIHSYHPNMTAMQASALARGLQDAVDADPDITQSELMRHATANIEVWLLSQAENSVSYPSESRHAEVDDNAPVIHWPKGKGTANDDAVKRYLEETPEM